MKFFLFTLTIVFTIFIESSLAGILFVIPELNTKLDAIDSTTSTQTTNIATNVTNIATNVTNIATNVTDIATNVTDIATNVTDITAIKLESADGVLHKRVARATWDFAADGGTISAIDLSVTIPAKALINFVYFFTVTQVTDGGAGTGALSCEDADNLFVAADVTGNADGTVVLGVPQNGAANMVKAIAANCNITWTIGGANATAGKLIFFVEYTIVE